MPPILLPRLGTLSCYDVLMVPISHIEQLFACFQDGVAGKAKKCCANCLCESVGSFKIARKKEQEQAGTVALAVRGCALTKSCVQVG